MPTRINFILNGQCKDNGMCKYDYTLKKIFFAQEKLKSSF